MSWWLWGLVALGMYGGPQAMHGPGTSQVYCPGNSGAVP